ncbi:Hypothetical protein FKW44_020794, partial [Caligus rogercresseyi]
MRSKVLKENSHVQRLKRIKKDDDKTLKLKKILYNGKILTNTKDILQAFNESFQSLVG